MNKEITPLIVFAVLAVMVTGGLLYLGMIDDISDVLIGIFGVVVANFTASVNYLVGSSAGSARKDKASQ